MNIRIPLPASGPPWLGDVIRTIEDWLRRIDAPRKYTVATLPDPAANEGRIVYVADETDGACVAFSNGTDWLRSYDLAVVS
jgi:hypothetical protein